MLSALAKILWPEFCLLCGVHGQLLCAKCAASKLVHYANHNNQQFDGVTAWRAAVIYDKSCQKVIREFKYNGVFSLSEMLGELLRNQWKSTGWRCDIAVPVPLSKTKLWARGFNQAELLAASLGLPVSSVLCRQRHTKAQFELGKAQRMHNVIDAFGVVESLREKVTDKSVLLVDDIITTGATTVACAKKLLDSGATGVYALALARAEL